MQTLPKISLRQLKNNERECELQKLKACCTEHGFFYLDDLDLPDGLVQKTIMAARGFFQSSLDYKSRFAQEKQVVTPQTCRGYVPIFGETLHSDAGPDCKELFDFGIERELNGQYFVGPTIGPLDKESPMFCALQYELQAEVMSNIFPCLISAIADSLDFKSDILSPFFTDPTLIQRVIHYPPGNGNAGKHTDNGILTILFQEEKNKSSLRVYSRDSWIDAPCIPNTVIVNLGDMLQMWTSGLYVSTPHEVVHHSSSTRISIPFFIYPNIDTIIEPIGTEQKVNSLDVMLENFNSIWVKGEGAGRAKELT